MMAFRRACKGLNTNGRNATADRMKSIPESVQDVLFEKFTEMPRDSEEYVFSTDQTIVSAANMPSQAEIHAHV